MKTKFRLALAVVSLLLILPVLGLFTDNTSEMLMRARRVPTAFPRLEAFSNATARKLFRDFDSYWADHLGLRQRIMDATSRLAAVFRFSPSPGQAIHGVDDWLFLGNLHDRTLDKLTGRLVMSDLELQERLQFYENAARAAQARGAKFVLLVAPDKHSIYPEYLPGHVRPAPQRYGERLLAALRARGVEVYDAAPTLLAAKDRGLLYYRSDTHWNLLGAYAAFEGLRAFLLDRMGMKLPPMPETLAFSTMPTPPINICGDLVALGNFHMPWRRPDEHYVISGLPPGVLTLENEQGMHEVPRNAILGAVPDGKSVRITNAAASVRGRLWLVHDSFTGALSPFINNSFREIVYRHHMSHWNSMETISGPAPDLVILQVLERML